MKDRSNNFALANKNVLSIKNIWKKHTKRIKVYYLYIAGWNSWQFARLIPLRSQVRVLFPQQKGV